MDSRINLQVTDMHTGGEAVRIVTGGYPALKGATMLEKRRDALASHDHLRALLMREPRGHAEMYGVIPTEPCHPEAALGVLFMHNGGYSTMCGHATIALGRYALDGGLVEATEGITRFLLDCPCGLVEVRVEVSGGRPGRASFESVPAYLHGRNIEVETRLSGTVRVDIAYGGAYYAFCTAKALGLDIRTAPLAELKARAVDITNTLRANYAISHPVEPDLGFLYGTIITKTAHVAVDQINHHLCWFADGQLDRSPTGSGVTARLAMAHAKGELQTGECARFAGITGVEFDARITRASSVKDVDAIHVEVGGHAWYSGTAQFVLEEGDPIPDGYLDPSAASETWG